MTRTEDADENRVAAEIHTLGVNDQRGRTGRLPVVAGGDDGESWPWPGAEIPNLSSLTCCRFGQPAAYGWVRSK